VQNQGPFNEECNPDSLFFFIKKGKQGEVNEAKGYSYLDTSNQLLGFMIGKSHKERTWANLRDF